MKLIDNKDQLLKNIQTVERYLENGSIAEQDEIKKLIARGKCFVAYKIKNENRFAPSRFLGYVSNNLKEHDAARDEHEIDGKDSNPAITSVLNQKLSRSGKLENEYLAYCNRLGIDPSNYSKRRYWQLDEL